MIGRIGDEAEGQLLAWSKLGMQLHCGIEMETSPAPQGGGAAKTHLSPSHDGRRQSSCCVYWLVGVML